MHPSSEAQIARNVVVIHRNRAAISEWRRLAKYYRLLSSLLARRIRQRRMVAFLAERVHRNQLIERFFADYLRLPDELRPELVPLDEFTD